MPKKIVVVGGGHNGLVAAAYLAKAGHEVTVLEARAQVGGAASSDATTFPGFTLSTASYLNSLFLPEIVRDLDLKKYGYEVLPRNPSSFTPLPDGRSLLLGPDMARCQQEIGRFSVRDAHAYPKYEQALGEIADWMARLMTMTPPNIPPRNRRDAGNLLSFARHALRLSPRQMYRLGKLLLSDPIDYLDQWFESDVLKATLLTDAMIGATELNGYVLLHHVMGEAGGARGVWGYMRGGMGGISNAILRAAQELGVKVYTNAAVKRITMRGGNTVSGVRALHCRTQSHVDHIIFHPADVVVSAIDPTHTFCKLLSSVESIKSLARAVSLRDTTSSSMKINCVLSGLPDFGAIRGASPGPQHRGTIHISPSVEYILEALKDQNEGRPSAAPVLELTIPSVLDDTLAPKGSHVMNIFLQFYPYDGSDDADTRKMAYWNEVVVPTLRKYIVNWDEIFVGAQVLAPRDLEKEFGMPGGNIFHGGMGLGQLFSLRPARGFADYRTPLSGLYLSGAGMHPGGGVTGASGYNAAREVLLDIGS
jgi:phytoene dehydrogenase-like protein